jgi:hypothetical protein
MALKTARVAVKLKWQGETVLIWFRRCSVPRLSLTASACAAWALLVVAGVAGVAGLRGAVPGDNASPAKQNHPAVPEPAAASTKDTKESVRIDLIRSLSSEVAVAKIPLPRGKHGVFLDEQGHLDQSRANAELNSNGTAIAPGMPVEITQVSFKGDHVVFEINHGGKSGKKWYQHIEVGMGTPAQPATTNNQVLAAGSTISLRVPDKITELTVPRTKQLLASVLDFERHSPTVLYSPAVPPKFKEAIKKHQIEVGMDRDAVLSSKGPPDRKVRETHDGAEQEDWIYGLPPHVLFVSFDGDTVTKVQQY